MSRVDPDTLAAARLVTVLMENRYGNIRLLPNGLWAATVRFLFTHAIVVGRVRDVAGYEDRWCYASAVEAREALAAWDGLWRSPFEEGEGTEPTGWHRHPMTGRRREGDQEWIAL